MLTFEGDVRSMVFDVVYPQGDEKVLENSLISK